MFPPSIVSTSSLLFPITTSGKCLQFLFSIFEVVHEVKFMIPKVISFHLDKSSIFALPGQFPDSSHVAFKVTSGEQVMSNVPTAEKFEVEHNSHGRNMLFRA